MTQHTASRTPQLSFEFFPPATDAGAQKLLETHRALQNYITRTGLAGHTHNSITDPVHLERELALVRSNGYAHDNEELELGVRCIAAGIRDDSGELVAGLSISAPVDFLQNGWVEQLSRTAAQISASLGYDARDPAGITR